MKQNTDVTTFHPPTPPTFHFFHLPILSSTSSVAPNGASYMNHIHLTKGSKNKKLDDNVLEFIDKDFHPTLNVPVKKKIDGNGKRKNSMRIPSRSSKVVEKVVVDDSETMSLGDDILSFDYSPSYNYTPSKSPAMKAKDNDKKKKRESSPDVGSPWLTYSKKVTTPVETQSPFRKKLNSSANSSANASPVIARDKNKSRTKSVINEEDFTTRLSSFSASSSKNKKQVSSSSSSSSSSNIKRSTPVKPKASTTIIANTKHTKRSRSSNQSSFRSGFTPLPVVGINRKKQKGLGFERKV